MTLSDVVLEIRDALSFFRSMNFFVVLLLLLLLVVVVVVVAAAAAAAAVSEVEFE